MSIAIGGLFYNAEKYLKTWFTQLLTLTYPKNKLHLVFVGTTSKDKTEGLLNEFLEEYKSEYASVKYIHRDRIEGPKGLETNIKNVAGSYEILSSASEPHDLISIEQDNIVSKDSVERLLKMVEEGADICSGITFVLGGEANYKLENGGVLRITGMPHVGSYVITPNGGFTPISRPTSVFHLSYLPAQLVGKTLLVGATSQGLCYIKREVLDKVKFEWAKGWTQDLWFCYRAGKLGFKILCDTSLWYEHLHYSYKRWVDSKGRFFIYLRDWTNDLDVSAVDSVIGIVIPKEEVEKQNVPMSQLVVPTSVDLDLIDDNQVEMETSEFPSNPHEYNADTWSATTRNGPKAIKSIRFYQDPTDGKIRNRMSFLTDWCRKNNIKTALELGRMTGWGSTYYILKAGVELWSVDIDNANYKAQSLDSLPTYHKFVADDTKQIPEIEGKKFDLVFLDTSHEYRHTKYELKRYLPLAQKWFLADDFNLDTHATAFIESGLKWEYVGGNEVYGVKIDSS